MVVNCKTAGIRWVNNSYAFARYNDSYGNGGGTCDYYQNSKCTTNSDASNIRKDPRFRGPGDYALAPDSPLFEVVDPDSTFDLTLPSVDRYGQPRVLKLDIGAVEEPTIASLTPAQGAPGDKGLVVVVNGYNFSETTNLQFMLGSSPDDAITLEGPPDLGTSLSHFPDYPRLWTTFGLFVDIKGSVVTPTTRDLVLSNDPAGVRETRAVFTIDGPQPDPDPDTSNDDADAGTDQLDDDLDVGDLAEIEAPDALDTLDSAPTDDLASSDTTPDGVVDDDLSDALIGSDTTSEDTESQTPDAIVEDQLSDALAGDDTTNDDILGDSGDAPAGNDAVATDDLDRSDIGAGVDALDGIGGGESDASDAETNDSSKSADTSSSGTSAGGCQQQQGGTAFPWLLVISVLFGLIAGRRRGGADAPRRSWR